MRATGTSSQTPRPTYLVTTPAGQVTVPSWMRRFSPRAVAGKDLVTLKRLPAITVVKAGTADAILKQRGFLRSLAAKHSATPQPSIILFVFSKTHDTVRPEELESVLRYFSSPIQVDFARGAESAEFWFSEALAKLAASSTQPRQSASDSDILGEAAAIIAATRPLRSEAGRLSAKRIAEVFGLPVAELAGLLGRSRQTVSKTEDSEALQAGLVPFARIARLRASLSDADFRGWLNLPNAQLDGRTPQALIREGKAEVVADLVDDMLSGSLA